MKKFTAKIISARLSRYVNLVLGTGRVTLVAVTGSIGKTSAKQAIAQMLAEKYRLKVNDNSYNVPIAIELSFFGLELPQPLWNGLAWQKIFNRVRLMARDFPYDVVVLEVNEDDFDLIEGMIERLHPNVAVITGVAPAHMEKLKTMERVTRQTLGLARYSDRVIYNADFEQLAELRARPDTSGYGLSDRADIHFQNIRRSVDGRLAAELVIKGKAWPVKTLQVSRQSLYSLLAAAGVGAALQMNPKTIAKRLAAIKPVRGRMNLLPAIEGATLIDDSYNASPFATIAALRTLAEVKGKRKIAVLGSMNELGDYSPTGHREVGQAAAKVAELLITIGADAEKYLAPAAIKAGLTKSRVKIFQTPYEAGHYLKGHLQAGDVVLVKGSQNRVFAEEVSRIILDPAVDPAEVLVRQSDSWKRKKKKAFAL